MPPEKSRKRDRHVCINRNDWKLIELLASYQFLSVELAASILKRNEKAVRRRLMQLHQGSYLNRSQENLNAPLVYFLAEKGGRLAAELGYLSRPRWIDRKDPHHIRHDLQITEFRIALEAKLTVEEWNQWRGDLKETYGHEDFIPDAKFTLQGEPPSLLETVRSYESEYVNGESSLVRKLHSYDQARVFRVYLVMPTRKRIEMFFSKIEEELPVRNFWFTDEASFVRDPLGKIWWTPADFRDKTYSILKPKTYA